jgi:hypothetical protein
MGEPPNAGLAQAAKASGWRVDGGAKPIARMRIALNEGGKRESEIEQRFDEDGNLKEITHRVEGQGEDGRAAKVERTKVFNSDGSDTVRFNGTLTLPNGKEVPVTWEKLIAPDGRVQGKGEIKLPDGRPMPFGLNGFKQGNKPPRKFPKLGGPGLTGPNRPMPDRTGSGTTDCTDADKKLGESGKAPTSGVLSIQVVDDRMVMAGGAPVQIRFTGRGTNLGKGLCTYVNVFDALRTSDPASGGTPYFGAASGATYDADGLNGSVTIDPKSLEKRSYWLRFSTKMPDGTWEVAEGVLMTH